MEIDVSQFTTNPQIGADSGVMLARRIQNALPEDATPQEREAAGAIDDRTKVVEDIQRDRARYEPAKIRPALNEHNTRFGALHGALSAASKVPAEISDRGKRAEAMLVRTLPDGVPFLKTDADSAYLQGRRVLDLVEELGIAREIDDVIGPDFLEACRRASNELGEVLGVGSKARKAPNQTALVEALRDLSRAIGRYGRVLASTLDETDPASVARFLAAVAPIAEHRASMRGTPSTDGADPVVEPPRPVAPEAPAKPTDPSP